MGRLFGGSVSSVSIKIKLIIIWNALFRFHYTKFSTFKKKILWLKNWRSSILPVPNVLGSESWTQFSESLSWSWQAFFFNKFPSLKMTLTYKSIRKNSWTFSSHCQYCFWADYDYTLLKANRSDKMIFNIKIRNINLCRLASRAQWSSFTIHFKQNILTWLEDFFGDKISSIAHRYK